MHRYLIHTRSRRVQCVLPMHLPAHTLLLVFIVPHGYPEWLTMCRMNTCRGRYLPYRVSALVVSRTAHRSNAPTRTVQRTLPPTLPTGTTNLLFFILFPLHFENIIACQQPSGSIPAAFSNCRGCSGLGRPLLFLYISIFHSISQHC
ncbi:hypothetical protein F4823DRAFT_262326 [Ustulina deusta]|nr:hypothetical protein F4823DRAFT_262326 [Ustulina deusta]